jgi:hypothetical protein
MYLWIDYPDFDKELQIIRAKTPNIDERLAEQICLFMQEVRQMRLEKVPGIAETLRLGAGPGGSAYRPFGKRFSGIYSWNCAERLDGYSRGEYVFVGVV